MKLNLSYYGDPVLRKKTAPVTEITDELRQLTDDMCETMLAHDGWGLAGPQIGRSIALFILKIPFKDPDGRYVEAEKYTVYINPKILWVSDELMTINDGCLSLPKLKGEVSRPYRIKIEATDLEGKSFVEELADYQAYGALHENDHLNGVLFIDRMKNKKERQALDTELRRIKDKYYLKK